MKQITLRNIHTNETVTVELVSSKMTWQMVWVVKYQGVEQILSWSMGWTDKV